MSAIKRGNVWYARFEVKGQRFYESLGAAATKADALEYEIRIKSEILAGKLGKTAKHTIDEAVLRRLEEGTSLRSLGSLESQAANIMEHIEGRPLEQIVDAARDVKKAGLAKGLSPYTINNRVALLRRVANLAYDEWGWLKEDLGARIKTIGGEQKRKVFLSPTQAESLAEHCTHPVVAKAIRIYVRTGLRENELLGATEVIDGCIVATTYKGKKGERRDRLVPLPSDIPDIQIPIGITYNTLRHYFEKARVEAGLPHVRIHDLRHTFASWLAQSGASLVTIRDLLGHTTFAETTRYAHLLTSDLKKASEGVTKFISASCAKTVQKPRKPSESNDSREP